MWGLVFSGLGSPRMSLCAHLAGQGVGQVSLLNLGAGCSGLGWGLQWLLCLRNLAVGLPGLAQTGLRNASLSGAMWQFPIICFQPSDSSST